MGEDAEVQEVSLEQLRSENRIQIEAVLEASKLSASKGQSELSPEEVSSFEERPVPSLDFAQLIEQDLSTGERDKLDEYLASSGFRMDQLRFNGRIIAYGDVLVGADEVLQRIEDSQTITKGWLFAETLPNIFHGGVQAVPEIFAFENTTQKYFWRPRPASYFVIVPDSPSFLYDLVLQATNSIETIPGSCIGGSTFLVVTQTQYNSMAADVRWAHTIQIAYGRASAVCVPPPAGGGCGVFPRQTTVEVFPDFAEVTEMSYGPYVGIISSDITANTSAARGILTHEFMHNMGIAHLEDQQLSRVHVPGTANTTNVLSNMQRTNHPNYRATLQTEDNNVLKALYGSTPGCPGYTHGFTPFDQL